MTRAIDLFAGWGGFTAGAESIGVDVVWAANHWPLAVETHKLNHPRAEHVCQDLRQANWYALPAFDLLLASPACQGHSPASQPKRRAYHDHDRATAWAVVDCADATNPRAILVENVPTFRQWRLYPQWRAAIEALGYVVDEHVMCAQFFGVPQRRARLFITATRKPLGMRPPVGKELPFGPCLEVGAKGWRSATSENVRGRIARGRARCGRRFLSQHVTNHPGVPLHEPIRTITTKDQWILVDGDRYRPLTVRELARGMSFDDSYQLPVASRVDIVRGLGNAVPPKLAATMVGWIAEAA